MKKMRGITAVALVLLFALSAAGCSLVSVNEEKDMAQVVAKVGDVEILKSEYVGMFEYYLGMYQMFGDDPTVSEERLIEFQDLVFEEVLSGYVVDYKAREQGLDTLSAEEEATIEADVAAELESLDMMVREQLDMELEADPALDEGTREQEIFREIVLSYTGEDLGREEYGGWAREQLKRNLIRSKVQENFNAGVTVTEQEVADYFNSIVEADTAYYSESPAFYRGDQESYEMFGGDPIGYVPEGYIRVKHILFAPEEEIGEEYTALEAEMTALSEELGALTVEDEAGNAGRIAEIKAEYAEKRAEADAMYEAHFADSKAKAEEAHGKLLAGADFDAVMAEYNGDTDFADYEVIGEKGKLLSAYDGDDTDWSDGVKDAALALTEPGGYTAPIGDDEGYHILQYLGDEPAGPRSLSDYHDEVLATVLSDRQYEEWILLLEEWCRDTSIVTRYPDRIRDAGRAVG